MFRSLQSVASRRRESRNAPDSSANRALERALRQRAPAATPPARVPTPASPSQQAICEWWKARLAREFGEDTLRVHVDSGSEHVFLLGHLSQDELQRLRQCIATSGQAERVHNLVESR